MDEIAKRIQASLSLNTVYALAASLLGLLTVWAVIVGESPLGLLPDLPFGLDFPTWDHQAHKTLATAVPWSSAQTWGDVVEVAAHVVLLAASALAGQSWLRASADGGQEEVLEPPTRPACSALVAAAATQQTIPSDPWTLAIPVLVGLVLGALYRAWQHPTRGYRVGLLRLFLSELEAAVVDLLVALAAVVMVPVLWGLSSSKPKP